MKDLIVGRNDGTIEVYSYDVSTSIMSILNFLCGRQKLAMFNSLKLAQETVMYTVYGRMERMWNRF